MISFLTFDKLQLLAMLWKILTFNFHSCVWISFFFPPLLLIAENGRIFSPPCFEIRSDAALLIHPLVTSWISQSLTHKLSHFSVSPILFAVFLTLLFRSWLSRASSCAKISNFSNHFCIFFLNFLPSFLGHFLPATFSFFSMSILANFCWFTFLGYFCVGVPPPSFPWFTYLCLSSPKVMSFVVFFFLLHGILSSRNLFYFVSVSLLWNFPRMFAQNENFWPAVHQ